MLEPENDSEVKKIRRISIKRKPMASFKEIKSNYRSISKDKQLPVIQVSPSKESLNSVTTTASEAAHREEATKVFSDFDRTSSQSARC